MSKRGEKTKTIDLAQIGVNLSASPRGLKGAEAVISQNMTYGKSGMLEGRKGTTTIAGAQALGGEGLDLYRAYNGLSGKYTLVTFREGGNTKIGAWKAGETEFHTLQDSGGGDFTLADDVRVSFTTDYDPAQAKVVVAGTNGVDDPFDWDFTEWGNVTSYPFGTASIKLKHFMPTPFGFQGRGRRWAFLRDSELVTIHASDPDNHRLMIDQGESIFFEVPQEDYSNPVRAMIPYRNQISIFNLNSISTVYYTNNPDRFYDYNVITYDMGTLNPKTLTYYNGMIIFLGKKEPYLFAFDGARVHELDPERKLTKGIQDWFDLTQTNEISMDVLNDRLLISFPSLVNASVGADGNNWVCEINMSRLSQRGIKGFPATFHNIPAQDIIVSDASTDFGQVTYIDERENYVRRFYDFYDGTSNVYGDNNDQTGSDPDTITYRLMTGWIGFGGDFFKLTKFLLNADYKGTPAATDTLKIQYRFNGHESWSDLQIGGVRVLNWIPVLKNAFGREIQFNLLWTTKTARPLLYELAFKYVRKPGIFLDRAS